MMDQISIEDEKKPFDAEHSTQEEETQPDPDENLMLDQGNGRVWLVKIPKYLMERWSTINQEGIQLATIRVYKVMPGDRPRITLHLPPDPVTGAINTDEYELDMVNPQVENQIVVAEREKEPNSRARTTILTGRVKHECNVRPTLTQSYQDRVRERHRLYNEPKRSILRIEESMAGGQGAVNMMSSGVVRPGTSDWIKPKPKAAKGQFERMARAPRNQLLDSLFTLFRERDHWSIKTLRDKTQQPEAWLKEVLGEIASLHRAGEHNGMWELRASFKDDGVKGEGGAGPSALQMALSSMPGDVKTEGDGYGGEDDDEDEDEDDMEEVS